MHPPDFRSRVTCNVAIDSNCDPQDPSVTGQVGLGNITVTDLRETVDQTPHWRPA